jgi:hypothetical protein
MINPPGAGTWNLLYSNRVALATEGLLSLTLKVWNIIMPALIWIEAKKVAPPD